MNTQKPVEHTLTFLQSVDAYIARSISFLEMPAGIAEQISQCNLTYTVHFGVRLPGQMFSFTGWRSVHSEHAEPVKGGYDSPQMRSQMKWKL